MITVTLHLLRAHAKHFGKWPGAFDAHTDTYANGSKFDHGTMFYHAPNEGLIDPQHSVQVPFVPSMTLIMALLS